MISVKRQCDTVVSALKSLATARGVANIGVDLRFVAKKAYQGRATLLMLVHMQAVEVHGVIEVEAFADIIYEGHPRETISLRESPNTKTGQPGQNYSTYHNLLEDMIILDLSGVELLSSNNAEVEDPRPAFLGHKALDLCTVRPWFTSFHDFLKFSPGDYGYNAPEGSEEEAEEAEEGVNDISVVCVKAALAELVTNQRVTRSITQSAGGSVCWA